ncbi:MAG: threonylcarbamoyl-AMP synthase [Oscillospiraceae bacterium]|jgi:tRNA threonylcarbamoyl adenosine modification protein (Sua5/YciO/YrdC/YwlC family)/dephospho-CoA kinase|nr:threonylcarbamoyl-AMP synthase [Oscillospiraceae bacterium]
MRIFDGGSDADLREAALLLRDGGVVAIPTETVYGLAADASNPSAVARVFAVKGRPDDKPLPLLVADAADAARLCGGSMPPAACELAERFWPGPLTLVLPVSGQNGPPSVAVRCPAHPASLAILRHAGVPLALTSANRSGEPPPATASDVTLSGLAGIVDGGPCAVGRASAILDLTRDPPEILRHGAPVFGVTGPSGAGKSAVLSQLGELGAAVIRADGVYHALLQSHEPMLRELRERFPQAFPRSGLTFDRAAMRGIAFGDPAALTALNRITHTYVIAEIRRELARVFLNDRETPAAIEAIALIGSGLDALCSVKIAVTAPFETCLRRVMSRDGLSREDAAARLQNQKPNEYYISNCNILLENNGTERELVEKTDAIWKIYGKGDTA